MWHKIYSICLILFFNLYELFPAFICDNIQNLVISLFRVKMLYPFPSLLLHHFLVVACQINLQILLYHFSLLYQLILLIHFSFLYESILHFQTGYCNYISRNKLIGSYLLPNLLFYYNSHALIKISF